MFDVVIVSDFSDLDNELVLKTSGFAFLCRTLLFMGAWMENAGNARSWPLHLVAIGKTPEIVRSVAEEYQVTITEFSSHPLVSMSPFANKFYAWQIPRKTDHLLLLDVDTVLYTDPSEIAELRGCIAASPIYVNCCPMTMWKELYQSIDIPMPSRRMLSVCGESAVFSKDHKYNNDEPVPPFYNGGALLTPWACKIGEEWQKSYAHFFNQFAGKSKEWREAVRSDQPALSVAIENLRYQGMRVRWLPHGFNVWRPHLLGELVSSEEVMLFHAASIFRQVFKAEDLKNEIGLLIHSAPDRFVELKKVHVRLGEMILKHVRSKLNA